MKTRVEYLKLAQACLQVARNNSEPKNQVLLLEMANHYIRKAQEKAADLVTAEQPKKTVLN